METLNSTIKSIDIFGDGIHLKINKMQKAKTIVGGFLTILLAIASLTILIIMAWDIFLKQKPSVTLESKIIPNRPNITLDSYSFPVSLIVQDDQNHPYLISKYFTFEAAAFTLKTEENGTVTSLKEIFEYVPCKSYHFPLISNDTFYESGLNNYLCFENQNFTIGGFFDNSYMRYILLSIKKCINSTDNPVICAPESEIIDFFQHKDIAWNIYYQNTIFNTQNYTDPKINYIVNSYKSVKYGMFKLFEIHIMNKFLISDNGIIFESKEESSITSFSESDYDFTDMLEDGYLVSIFLFSSNKRETYNRSYIKLQWVIASVGALSEIFMHLFKFISSYFTNLTMNKYILNKIFDFDLINKNQNIIKSGKTINEYKNIINLENTILSRAMKQTKNIIISRNISEKDQTLRINNMLNQDQNSEMDLKSDLDKEKVLKIIEKVNAETNKSNLEISFKEMFLMIFCEKCLKNKIKDKFDLYNKSIRILDEYIDISYIIQKLEEFEKLKLICFNDEQLALFNFTSKDFCSLNDKKEKEKTFTRFKEFNKNTEKLSETICKFKRRYMENKDLSIKDLKIYDLLRDDLK